MSTDRHPKWVRVEPGTVIPAGQKIRYEWNEGRNAWEEISTEPYETAVPGGAYFIDSSWKPPLDLPTEPTWGIAVFKDGSRVFGEWRHDTNVSDARTGIKSTTGAWVYFDTLADFIPLIDEQVARIEAAR